MAGLLWMTKQLKVTGFGVLVAHVSKSCWGTLQMPVEIRCISFHNLCFLLIMQQATETGQVENPIIMALEKTVWRWNHLEHGMMQGASTGGYLSVRKIVRTWSMWAECFFLAKKSVWHHMNSHTHTHTHTHTAPCSAIVYLYRWFTIPWWLHIVQSETRHLLFHTACPPHYQLLEGSCYKHDTRLAGQSFAQSECQNDGANLVTIDSAEENELIAWEFCW